MNREEFMQHRINQEHIILTEIYSDPIKSLVSVEFNTTELCNRKCVFCPRVDENVYPNRKLHMALTTIDKITRDLKDIDFSGKISLSGFGEFLLHPNYIEIIKTIRKNLPDNIIEANTNGDRLTEEKIKEIYDAGLSSLYVNLYDSVEQINYFNVLFRNIDNSRYVLREHYNSDNTFNLYLNNRSGNIQSKIIGTVDKPLIKECHMPFFKAMIDYNGDLILCQNDWGRKFIVGSLLDNHIKDLWLGEKMKQIREKLINKDRSSSPCNKCNVIGTLTGEKSFNILKNYYSQK
jgi:radical SAM protein with 4Fe4S-binding SPASM domain